MSDAQGPGERNALISEAWYPTPASYWVPPSAEAERPTRYGDLFHAPPTATSGQSLVKGDGEPWHALMVLTPSCELGAKAKPGTLVEVARVIPLAAQNDTAALAIIAGWQEKDQRITVAFAHTVFLAGVKHSSAHAEGMFANLKDTVRVRFDELHRAGRIAALDHDARVAVIRRELYFRYRWVIPTDEVRANEAVRIRHDPAYTGPKPLWAS